MAVELTQERKGRPPRLPRNVLLLGWVSLLTDLSSEVLVRTLPLFLANVLGVRTSIIGLIEGVAESTATLLKLVSGWFSDRIGKRRPLVLVGYSLSALTKPFLYFAGTWVTVLAVRFLDRVGKGVRSSPRDALIADSTPASQRGRAFGYNRAMDPVGAVVGLLAAAALVFFSQRGLAHLTRHTFQLLVLLAVIPGLLAVLVLTAVREPDCPRPRAETPRLRGGGLDRQFRAFLAILVLFTLGNSSDAFLVLRAQNLGLSLAPIFLMLALFSLTTVVSAYPAGALSDRLGRRRLLLVGWLIYASVYLGFAFAHAAWQVWTLYVSYGLYYGVTDGVSRALVADLVPAPQRGTAFGLYNTAIGVAALPASLLAGWLWQAVNPAAPFLVGAALAGLAAVGLLLLIRR